MTASTRNSYLLIFAGIILAGWFGLGTPFLTVLFSYFALDKLSVLRRKSLTITLFILIVSVLCLTLGYFIDQAVRTLPHVVTTSIPLIIQYAQEHQLQLPFSDWDSLRAFLLDNIKGELHYLGNFAKVATKHFFFVVLGMVIAISLFLRTAMRSKPRDAVNPNSLFALASREIADRFYSLYNSFAVVMGAQLIISTINTGLTAVFVLCVSLPYSALVLVITFLCGLLPIVGNLISNSIIVIIAFTVTPGLAIFALLFLIILHKFEYFLNSKIIGDRTQCPVWLTLIGLIVGERLMGIAGMILAPVILHFLRIESSRIILSPKPGEALN